MFAPVLAAELRAAGFDVLAVAGHPVLAAADDESVAAAARAGGRRVVTENVRDYAPLRRVGEPLSGITTATRAETAVADRSYQSAGPVLRSSAFSTFPEAT